MSIHSSREFAAPDKVLSANVGRRENAPRPVNPVASFAAGERIFEQGERAGKVFTVKAGTIRIYQLLVDGRRQVLAFCTSGEVFGFARRDTYDFFAEAVDDCSVIVRGTHEALAEESLKAVFENLFAAQNHQLVLGRQVAGERIASFLIDMEKRQGGLHRIELPMTRADIADYLGLTVETISRGLSKLQTDGLIRLHSARSIEILRLQALRAMIE